MEIALLGNTELFTVDSMADRMPRVGIIATSLLQGTKIKILVDVLSEIMQFLFAMNVILLSQSLYLFFDRVLLPLGFD